MLRSLLNGTREYALLVEGETDYHGKDGARRVVRLGDVIAESWERALGPDRVLAALGGLGSRRCRSPMTALRGRRCRAQLSTPRPRRSRLLATGS